MTFKEALAVSILTHATKTIIPNLSKEERFRLLAFLDSIEHQNPFLQVHKALEFIEENIDDKSSEWDEHFGGKNFTCKENKNS